MSWRNLFNFAGGALGGTAIGIIFLAVMFSAIGG
jgi:hypothetical protein